MAVSFLLAETRVKGPIFSGKLRARKLVSSTGEALATNAIHNTLATTVPITLVVRRIFIRPTNLPQNEVTSRLRRGNLHNALDGIPTSQPAAGAGSAGIAAVVKRPATCALRSWRRGRASHGSTV